MRILRIEIDGISPYRDDRLALDLYATDRVVRPAGSEIPEDVTRVGSTGSIYSLSVIGISGVNASGKTTTLAALQFVLTLLLSPSLRRYLSPIDASTVRAVRTALTVEVVFWEGGAFYFLRSEMEPDGDGSFRFVDEWLWKLASARASKRLVGSTQEFMAHAGLVIHRNELSDAERRFLGPHESVVSSVVHAEPLLEPPLARKRLPQETLPSEVVQAFDPSIERLEWNERTQVFCLQFKGEEPRYVSYDVAETMLSNGTVVGAGLVTRAIDILHDGSSMLVDEIEVGLNRALVQTVIELFASPVTNPNGAQLVFTTHDPEILDMLHRKDSVYLLVRDAEHKVEVVKYSDRIPRIENKKSDVVLSNMIHGTMPRYPDMRAMREYVREHVHE